MSIVYREGRKEDSLRIAQLDDIASGGAIEYLFHDLIPGMSPVEIVASNLENDRYPHSYRSAIVAEKDNSIIGMALSFPGIYHCITNDMREFFPPDRLLHFHHMFTAPVRDSYFLDAICVDQRHRNKGIGSKLIDLTKEKAHGEGYSTLSLIAFADNAAAIKVYRQNRFDIIQNIELKPHRRIPHEGGCVLMVAPI